MCPSTPELRVSVSLSLCLLNAKHVLYVHMRRKLYDFECNVKYATGDTKPILEDTWKGTQLSLPPWVLPVYSIYKFWALFHDCQYYYTFICLYISLNIHIVCIVYISCDLVKTLSNNYAAPASRNHPYTENKNPTHTYTTTSYNKPVFRLVKF